jgi:hypothetical protein
LTSSLCNPTKNRGLSNAREQHLKMWSYPMDEIGET